MKLYEYQAKQILQNHGVSTPKGEVVFKPTSTTPALKTLGRGPWAIKAQILAGGRGKAGGVKIVSRSHEAHRLVWTLLTQTLVTSQTGPQGEKINSILIESARFQIQKEMYAAVIMDRETSRPILILSGEGGMDIETLAKQKPNSLRYIPIDPGLRLPLHQARLIAGDMGLNSRIINEAAYFLSRLVDIFFEIDASIIEINPWVITSDNSLLALDAKISTDENALFRQPRQMEWLKNRPCSRAEKLASQAKISYLKLNGNVGCLVNGAGLAMATMDIIKLHGGAPANFLDVGGGANMDQVTQAFKIILSDKQVKGILVNIFGGIMRCDVIAKGIIQALKRFHLKVPMVVRLEGHNAQEGKKILERSKLKITMATDFSEAASQIVKAVGVI